MSGRATVMLATILAGAAVFAGCGGGGGSGSSGDGTSEGTGEGGPAKVASVTLSKAEYTKQGEAICEKVPERYNSRLEKLPEKQQENPKKSVPQAAIPPLWKAVEEFAALGAPKGEEAKAQAIVVALENAAKGLEKEPKGELSGPESAFAEFNKLTKAYKMEFCSQL